MVVPTANLLISWEFLPPEQKVGGSNPLGRTTELPAGHRIVKRSVLGGLHHEYSLAKEAA